MKTVLFLNSLQTSIFFVQRGVYAQYRFVFPLALAAGIYLHSATGLRAEPPAAPKATVTVSFADGTSLRVSSNGDSFQRIALGAGEAVTIKAQLPPRLADLPAFVQALDGGTITADLAIDGDGSASLGFQAGTQAGVYRLLFSAKGRSAMLEFEVLPAEQ